MAGHLQELEGNNINSLGEAESNPLNKGLLFFYFYSKRLDPVVNHGNLFG